MGRLWQAWEDAEKPRIALLGAGVSARAVLDWIRERYPGGWTVTLRERRPGPPPDWARDDRVTWMAGETWLSELTEPVIFRSPGVRPDLPSIREAVRRGAVLTGEIPLFCRLSPAALYAVTGSDGKTTTAHMTYALLDRARQNSGTPGRVWLGGNVGTPLLPHLSGMHPEDRAVLELSSFQLMDACPATHRAALLNVTPNHLDWHLSMEEYKAAKAHLLLRAERRVLCADDAFALSRARPGDILFSARSTPREWQKSEKTHTCIWVDGGLVRVFGPDADAVLFRFDNFSLHSNFFLEDAMAAAGLTLGDLPPAEAGQVLCAFRGVPHRMQTVAVREGVTCIDSSIDTTPSRTAATLSAIPGKPTVLCGGSDKGLSYAPLAEALAAHAGRVVLTGATAGLILAEMDRIGFPAAVPVTLIPDFGEAVRYGLAHTPRGEVLLLSPACASFDAFVDYRARGDLFRDIVTGA